MKGSVSDVMALTDQELERYSRQLILPGFELEHQQRLRQSRVLVVGCGGLGNPVAQYLAGAGIGEVILADGDTVELSNLHRQPLYGQADVGKPKAAAAAALIADRYPDCTATACVQYLAESDLQRFMDGVHMVVDCSDNYPIRFALNRACIGASIPLVSAAAVRLEGQLTTFHSAAGGPCYRCLYPQEGDGSALSCRESGVLGPVVGTLGSLEALEAIRVLSGWGENLIGRLLLLDLATHSQNLIAVGRRADCPDCGGDGVG